MTLEIYKKGAAIWAQNLDFEKENISKGVVI